MLGVGVSTPPVPARTQEASRLGTTAARLKLKGIDGGPHKQRSVWFNSTQREEPYLGLTCTWYDRESGRTRKGACADAAWLSRSEERRVGKECRWWGSREE